MKYCAHGVCECEERIEIAVVLCDAEAEQHAAAQLILSFYRKVDFG